MHNQFDKFFYHFYHKLLELKYAAGLAGLAGSLTGAPEPGNSAIIIYAYTGNDEGFQRSGDSFAGIIGDEHDRRNYKVHYVSIPILVGSVIGVQGQQNYG